MKNQKNHAALAAGTATAALRASIVSAPGGGEITVDEAAGTLLNVALMNCGEAIGHGFSIDLTTLAQVRDLVNAEGDKGIKVRFRHPQSAPGSIPDDLGDVIGTVTNARIDGESLRGDLQLGDYAEVLPGLGDVRTYLLRRAKSDPTRLGLSAVIGFDTEPVMGRSGKPIALVARVFELEAIDVVGKGAATAQNGLLAAAAPVASASPPTQPTEPAAGAVPAAPKPVSQLQQRNPMDPAIKQYLVANHGLAADASDDDAQAMFDSLSPDAQGACKASMSAAAPVAATLSARTPASPAPAQSRTALITDDGDRLLAMEGKRVTQIAQLATLLKVPNDVAQLAIAQGETVVDAKARFLKHLSDTATPIHSVKVGEDKNRASLAAAIPDAIRLRAGVDVKNPHERAQQLRHRSLADMARTFFVSLGVPTEEAYNLSPVHVAELLGPRNFARKYPQYAQLAQSSSDFTSILADTINKTLRNAYMDAPRTWNIWARRTTNPDFKTITRAALSASPDLVARDEGKGISYVTLSDSKETYSLSEYTGGIKLTRRAIINDDLDAFSRIPMLQGNAAARKEDDVAYAIITANATMADTGALFNSTAVTTAGGHANYTSSGLAVSVASLAAQEKLLKKQKGPEGASRLELRAKFLLVPSSIYRVAQQVVSSTVDPAKNNAAVNPFLNEGLVVVSSARLDDNSATAWYLLADYRDGQVDTVEVCFLADEPEPVAKQETDFDTEDVKFAIRHTVAAKAIDFRGMTKQAGA